MILAFLKLDRYLDEEKTKLHTINPMLIIIIIIIIIVTIIIIISIICIYY